MKDVIEMLKVITSVVQSNQSLLMRLTQHEGSADSSAEMDDLRERLNQEEEKSRTLADMLEKCIADNDSVCFVYCY